MQRPITDVYPDFFTWPGAKVFPRFDNGSPHREERMALTRIALHVNTQTAFEIGTFDGGTARSLAQVPGMEQVWTLDLPRGANPALPVMDDDYLYMGREKYPSLPNVQQLWGDSATFDFAPYEARCDLVFVMGAHSPEYIRNDLAVALRLVSAHGAVVWHGGTADPVAAVAREYDLLMISERMGWVQTGV